MIGMRNDLGDIAVAELESALGWWIEAGVDVIVEETPRDWMRRATPLAAPPEPVAAEVTAPADLTAFRAWLASAELPSGGGARVAPSGDPASGLMVIADMPEDGDPIGGKAGLLFDRMLAAIGRDRGAVYLAPLSPTHFPAGRIPAEALPPLAAIARRHVALAAPAMLLLLGDAPAQALLGLPMAAARGRLHKINHDGVTVPAIATFHPRFLLQRPACKADAWADLRLMLEELRL